MFTGCTIQKVQTGIKTDPDTRLIYVLQKAGFKELKKSEFEIAIVDPDDSKLTGDDLKILHSQASGRHPFKEVSDKYHKMTGTRYTPQQIARALTKQ